MKKSTAHQPKILIDILTEVHSVCKGSQSLENATAKAMVFMKPLLGNLPKDISPSKFVLLAHVLTDGLSDERTASLISIANHFDMSRTEALSLITLLEEMVRDGYLERDFVNEGRKQAMNNTMYLIGFALMEELMKNNLPEQRDQLKADTVRKILDLMHKCTEKRRMNQIKTSDLILLTERLMDFNPQNHLVKKTRKIFRQIEGESPSKTQLAYEFILLAKLLNNYREDDKEFDPNQLSEEIFEDDPYQYPYYALFLMEIHPLLMHNLVQKVKKTFKTTEKLYEFTLEGVEELLGKEFESLVAPEQNHHLLDPSFIAQKALFFDPKQSNDLETLSKLFERNKFENAKKAFQESYKNKGGIAILLHGLPGTGKTEFVMQIARISGRPLFKVDLSETKSMWHGESEKQVKRIFTRYKKACEDEPHTPVLFVNEADALFSKRLDVTRSFDQTANAIQNILLDELDNFEGILMATTNLTSNFDSAFERRFLMKIHFGLPEESTRARIWKDKLPKMPEPWISKLSKSFQLSPAQIENVARKAMISELLDHTITETDWHTLCAEELGDKNTAIGFR